MERILKVSLGEFTRLGNARPITYGRNNVTMLTGNANFKTLPKPLAEVAADLDDLEIKTAAALSRDRMAIAARTAAREVVLTDLREYAATVQLQCSNDLTKLVSSGFQATKARRSAGVPVPPFNLHVSYTGVSSTSVSKARVASVAT